LFAAISFDEGQTWPVHKLITPGGSAQTLQGGAWTGSFTLDDTPAEPKGYLAATQSPDNLIHLISSRLYYRFNLPWLTTASSSDSLPNSTY
jgi:sulfatase modifying factor 1